MNRRLIEKLKLLLFAREEFYYTLKRLLGIKPKQLSLYKLALTDKSLLSSSSGPQAHSKSSSPLNNERLEFLGDAILDAVVASYLYKHLGHINEGDLTTLRSRLVNRSTLNMLAKKAHIDVLMQCLYPQQAYVTTGHNIYGNALEAIIGAIYLDKGYDYTEHFIVDNLIKKHINFKQIIHQEDNPKSKLIEWGQKHKKNIRFELVKEGLDSDNHPFFQTIVSIDTQEVDYGVGRSKKESEQKAAKYALRKLKKLFPQNA